MSHITTTSVTTLTILLSFWASVEMSKILIVSLQQKSHMIFMHAAGEGLLERGHEVFTVMGSYIKEPEGMTEMGFKILRFKVPEDVITFVSPEIQDHMRDTFMSGKIPEHHRLAYYDCERMLTDLDFMQKLQQINFDIAIVDGFPIAPCGFLIPHLLGIPYVYMSSAYVPGLMRIPALPSFVPMIMTPYSDNMSFFQRMSNLIRSVAFESGLPVLGIMKVMNNFTLIEKYSKDPAIHTWRDFMKRSELFMITRGSLLEWPMPYMPNVIPLEGITARPAKDLPPGELLQFVEESTEYIVVVSFGSMLGSFPDEINQKFISAFEQRKENFIWKVSMKSMKHLKIPSNVKLMSWLPQNELLAHPKTKLFITHCGNNGQYEAVYHGVPMIGFPIFGEQSHNAVRLVSHGFGLSGDLKQVTSEDLVGKIEEILSNSKYHDNVKKASMILKSSPQNARQQSAYWVEHVIKFGGQHLRSYAMDLPWYQYVMLDMALFLFTILLIGLFCIKYTFIVVCKCLTQGKSKVKRK